MWYQFNEEGTCVSTCTKEIEPMDGITSVFSEEIFTDIENVRLVNGVVNHTVPQN